MKNILLPTDFSDNARHAIKYALELFDESDAVFHLVNAYEPPHPTGMLIKIDDIIRDDAINELKKEERWFKQNIALKASLKPVAQLGELPDALDQLWKEKKADLVVMGTKGASGIKEIFFGSNTTAVIESSLCSVLAVPNNASLSAPKTIVLAADYEHLEDMTPLTAMKNLAVKSNAKVLIVNVSSNNEGELKFNPVIERIALSDFLGDIPHSYNQIENENIATGLEQFIQDNNADLLTMLPGKSTFFTKLFRTSVTKQMALHSQVPILALRS